MLSKIPIILCLGKRTTAIRLKFAAMSWANKCLLLLLIDLCSSSFFHSYTYPVLVDAIAAQFIEMPHNRQVKINSTATMKCIVGVNKELDVANYSWYLNSECRCRK